MTVNASVLTFLLGFTFSNLARLGPATPATRDTGSSAEPNWDYVTALARSRRANFYVGEWTSSGLVLCLAWLLARAYDVDGLDGIAIGLTLYVAALPLGISIAFTIARLRDRAASQGRQSA